MDTDLIKLFNLMGIDIKQYVDVLPTTADTQVGVTFSLQVRRLMFITQQDIYLTSMYNVNASRAYSNLKQLQFQKK